MQVCVGASKDPVTGIDETAGRFRSTIIKKFKELSPNEAHEKTYRGGTLTYVSAKIDEVAADVQELRDALRHLQVCTQTGLTKTGVLSITIGIHLHRRDTMSYEA